MTAYNDESGTDSALRRSLGVSRRRFLSTCTAAAATAIAAPAFGASPAFAQPAPHKEHGHGHGQALVPAAKRGIILYTVRDATGRDPLSSDLPSGFREVFKELARYGYKQVEFAGYGQHANAPGGSNLETVEGAKLLRSWLDDYGLRAQGNHGFIPSSWPLSQSDLDQFKRTLEIANILGMDHMGTGGDPTGSAYRADWDVAADKWNALGQIAHRAGIKLYTHNHDAAYGFLLDGGPLDAQGRPTRSSGIRKLEYFLKVTDPKTVWLEMDIFWAHVAQYKFHTYTAHDGTQRENIFDPAALVRSHNKRYPLFHAKDGVVNTTSGQGYDMVPFGTGVIDYRTFFRRVGEANHRNPMVEQDNAPSSTDLAQSLKHARIGYDNLAALRK
ncbi:sugar phosphate isomerase/epimerase [Streptomyces sp. NBC_00121]|uniref:sugar phosphate isomerase/epimerase family protein n=1 Tax=unclassified Streptomyces TaxID=2593676 RepID=UPI002DDB4658|nr:sugar phosphate isomerase/epimerase family protein [Streptomyces sp. NBC_01760]WSC72847.1 sugar phosphate isomerase/epimerase [Streptomyces sp. NBC_01760]WTE63286.1 sugar phosphate isomerase/epimerase [Streptomyces sp. NBC_01617]WTI90575.1 sugar phosphate isomerase/epimerase [Streptomyces sp. NBC_00724]